ncbi:zinc ABC transporter ATP-binding protein [Lottiidibacillus patelloidae]|uniref:Zinc ABC transporter ATP-binding protein n=1 Tax=Lottiidibacillus patelloidae TaxID=2670334 RepID=A0A263BVW4_9BACI|nr:metal ABC transporter ATP-binding protein [Lottiidibacillus patelloidae]OZM57708.1 zinc ABC transporter ATP-binding protein [Lottiidibacillus patelloidae]
MDQSTKVLEISNVTYRYDDRNVIEDVSLTINRGDFLGLVGPNGSGKSTLIKIILGLIKPDKGTVLLFGENQDKFKQWQKIGYVSQKANSFNSGFPATVFEVVAMGLVGKKGLFSFQSSKDKKLIDEAIETVGMSAFKKRNIGELSGGQQQRVFIARALVSDPELLILDEPTVGVDNQHVQSFYKLLTNLNRNKGITLLLVSHDVGVISEKVTNVACINKTLHFHGDREAYKEYEKSNLSSFYGHDVKVITHDHEHGGITK